MVARVSEEAGQILRAAWTGVGLRCLEPAPFTLAKLEGSSGLRGRLRSVGRPNS